METTKIPFNKQNLFGNELQYISDAFSYGKVSGDGIFTKKCSAFISNRYSINKVLLTTSCTHALELSAMLINLKSGDEVILPSYTFVSTVNAIVLRGAKPVFCDIREDNLNIDEEKIEELITDKTKAIIAVHYAGVACEMDKIMDLSEQYNLWIIEDAAQAINAKYKEKYLGSIGHFGTFSFHETKNISCGEGGALLINCKDFEERAEIIREKGTNRSKFFRGLVDKYSWVDIGSSYLPSEINAAVLLAQLENIDKIQKKRESIYKKYYKRLISLQERNFIRLPEINSFAKSNFHLFYIILNDNNTRDKLMKHLKSRGIIAVFHYLPLHKSEFYHSNYDQIKLPLTEDLSSRLLRLPIYYSLKLENVNHIIDSIMNFFKIEVK